jgi:hypothetical protein
MGDKISGALKSAAGTIAGEGLPESLLARWDAEGGRDLRLQQAQAAAMNLLAAGEPSG